MSGGCAGAGVSGGCAGAGDVVTRGIMGEWGYKREVEVGLCGTMGE